jgi:hypothetical protein
MRDDVAGPDGSALIEGLGRWLRSARTAAWERWQANTGRDASRLVWGEAETAGSLCGAAVACGKPLGGPLGRR